MTLDRKDYKSAIPQLEGRLEQIEKLGKDVFNKFEDIAHKTQLDAAEAEKKAAALDFQMDTLNVVMEYQLVQNGQTPVEANWSTTMPTLDKDTSGYTVWYRSVTYRNEIAVRKTDPQTVNIMDGVYAFVNTVSGEDAYGHPNWTTIDGSTIKTGRILSHSGYCYFDLDDNAFQMKDAYNLQQSNSVLAWDNGQLYVKGKICIGGGYDERKYYTWMTGNGFDIVANNDTLAHFGYDTGNALVGTSTAPYYSLGTRKIPTAPYDPSLTYMIGGVCVYDGKLWACTQDNTTGTWNSSRWMLLIGNYSLANGRNLIASGDCSHAEGMHSIAMGARSHAEGSSSEALGEIAHAEGMDTRASGAYSHAQNRGTLARYVSQTAIGDYNTNASSNYAFEIGNGSVGARSNAFTVTWDGDVNIPSGAKYKINGTDIFSGLISIQTSSYKAVGNVASGGYTTGSITCPTVDGYSARCVVGWNFNNETSSQVGETMLVLNRLYLNQSEQKVYYTVRNVGDSAANTSIRVFILYTRV